MSGARAARLLAAAILVAAAAGADSAGRAEPPNPAEYAAAVRRTVSGATVHAVLGPDVIPLPIAASNFLLDHPDLSAFIVNREKIAPYKIEMLSARRSLADDGDGTEGVLNLLERTGRHRLYYGEGVHHSRVFPDIRAAAVISMDLSAAAGPDGGERTMTTFRVWVRIKSRFVAGLVRTLRPFLRGVVVRKFSKAFTVAESTGRFLARDPGAAAADVDAFPGLHPEERAEILAMISRLKKSPLSAAPAGR
ncbi:MAG TPA: hypothetical protein VH309_08345 [Elusimicrobiota bacterium]|jgi:hypothetical protein|nr:hypothetical protein [Elusimicrobiota bacterium]